MNYDKKIWRYVVSGKSKEEIHQRGIPMDHIETFFNDWSWKIEQLNELKQDEAQAIKDEVDRSSAKFIQLKNKKWLRRYTCPLCQKKIERQQIRTHLNEVHPISDPPIITGDRRKFKEWYVKLQIREGFLKYLDGQILYTPMSE